MKTYYITYKIGGTELGKCCFDIAEAYEAVRDIREGDVSLWAAFSMPEMMGILVDMERGYTFSFETQEKLRVVCRKEGESDAESEAESASG